ncbi:hypothetical protein [Serratia marcescens]|uniref:Uncharacterized protein n=1 Tax=Serratia marcescens TaxID=615 RepID=A0ABD5IHA8_SERMA|nr:hypothetical protein [Serratia marcescens]MDX7083437.1 hypothetical protein [Serratia marcescens]
MNWQGIPFKFFGEEPVQQAFLSVSHIPNIVVKNDFAYDTFFSALIGGAIPALVAGFAIYSSNKNMKAERQHQKELTSKNISAQIVSASRQVWINDLRDAGAKYIGVVSSVTNCLNVMAWERRHGRADTELYLNMREEERVGKGELGVLKTKIELLLNPDEESSKRICKALEDIRMCLIDKNRPRDERIDFKCLRPLYSELTSSIYEVVKSEWNKLKDI